MKGPYKDKKLTIALGTEKGATKPIEAQEEAGALITDDEYSLAIHVLKDGFCRIVLTNVMVNKAIELWAGPMWALAQVEPLHSPRVISKPSP